MSDSTFYHLKLFTLWTLISSITFLFQSLIELFKWLNQIISPNIPNLAVIFGINFIEWRGDIFTVFASFTITATLLTGMYHILRRKEYRLGVAFILVGAGISFVIGSFFILLNMADFSVSLLEFISSDAVTSMEWKARLWSPITTMLICLPLLTFYKYLGLEAENER